MAKYSDIYFPISGGSSNLAGFEWSEKTADFTAEASKAYYCDTSLNNILIALPSLPQANDEIAFLIIGLNQVRITTEDKIKGNVLLTDYVKKTEENYIMFVFTYVDTTTGWDWDIRYDNYVVNYYTGSGIVLPYTNLTTNDGLIKYLATSGGQVAFSNPYPASVTVNLKNATTGIVDGVSMANIPVMFDEDYVSTSQTVRGAKINNAGAGGTTSSIFQIEVSPVGSFVVTNLRVVCFASSSRACEIKGVKHSDDSLITLITGATLSSGSNNFSITSTEILSSIIIESVLYPVYFNDLEVWGTYYP